MRSRIFSPAVRRAAPIDRVVWATRRTAVARRDADIGAALAATAASAMGRA
jgi:hypothetical protein